MRSQRAPAMNPEAPAAGMPYSDLHSVVADEHKISNKRATALVGVISPDIEPGSFPELRDGKLHCLGSI
jgi:hypothetical protein